MLVQGEGSYDRDLCLGQSRQKGMLLGDRR